MASPLSLPGTLIQLWDRAQDAGVSLVGQWGVNRTSVTRVYDLYQNVTDPAGNPGGGDLHFEAIYRLLGYPHVEADASGNKYLSRELPHGLACYQNPRVAALFPNKPFLFATGIKAQGHGARATGTDAAGQHFPKYDIMRLDVTYETLPYEVLPDGHALMGRDSHGNVDESQWSAGAGRYISKVAKPAGEFFTIPTTSGYKYVMAGTPTVERGIGKLLSFCNLQVTWHQVPETAVPSMFVNPNVTTPSAIETTIGKVNNAAFNGYRAGTLLLLGASLTPYRSPFGVRMFDITYMFKYFEPVSTKGHQFIFRPILATSGWYEVTTSGATNLAFPQNNTDGTDPRSIYDWASYPALFRVP